jgi:hypothetical protein
MHMGTKVPLTDFKFQIRYHCGTCWFEIGYFWYFFRSVIKSNFLLLTCFQFCHLVIVNPLPFWSLLPNPWMSAWKGATSKEPVHSFSRVILFCSWLFPNNLITYPGWTSLPIFARATSVLSVHVWAVGLPFIENKGCIQTNIGVRGAFDFIWSSCFYSV